MSRLDEKEYTYFTTIRGMCRSCRAITPSRVFFQDGQVYQQNLCPACENPPVKICNSVTWYLDNVAQWQPDHSPLPHAHEPKQGCPHDCGHCSWHTTPCQLPVMSITNDCDMRCPICFTHNRNDKFYYISGQEMEEALDRIIESSSPIDLINLTGGEPTRHPDIVNILRQCAAREGTGRVTMNSNGLRLAEDFHLCEQIAEIGASVILSFHTFDAETSIKIHGQDVVEKKLQAIENLKRAGAKMTLLNVLIRDTNEDAIRPLFDLLLSNSNILSLTIQTMTYTGQGGGTYPDRRPIPVDEAAEIVARESGGLLEFSDFTTRPSAHPLCYMMSYLVRSGKDYLPLSRMVTPGEMRALLRDSYLIRVSDKQDNFRDIIDRLYSRGDKKELQIFRNIISCLFPDNRVLTEFERQNQAEAFFKTIYIHAHMDEDTFDCSRVMQCPDKVPVEGKGMIPACNYNLFYRMQDERFYTGAQVKGSGVKTS